jgi:hypothetical protein
LTQIISNKLFDNIMILMLLNILSPWNNMMNLSYMGFVD